MELNKKSIPQNEVIDRAQRARDLCKKLLPALRDGAECNDCRVAPLALALVIRAVAEHLDLAA